MHMSVKKAKMTYFPLEINLDFKPQCLEISLEIAIFRYVKDKERFAAVVGILHHLSLTNRLAVCKHLSSNCRRQISGNFVFSMLSYSLKGKIVINKYSIF